MTSASEASAAARPRTLAICADDFGQTPGISRAIARLAGAGRVNVVSCLVNAEGWRPSVPLLHELPPTVSLGLHFNLTEGRPLSTALRRHWPTLPTLRRLLLLAGVRRLPLKAIADEFTAQLEAHTDATGRPPDHLDGHQHVHHLWGVRDVLLAAWRRLPATTAVRNTGAVRGPQHAPKRRIIEATGGWALQRALRARAVLHNPALLGVYDFADTDYRRLLRGWLVAVPPEGALLFCHPGDPGAPGEAGAAGDPIAAARVRERDHLHSTAFVDDLAAAGVVLGPAWPVLRCVSGKARPVS